MDNIHAGWLTKSPRQRKTSTLWKLFRSRWRRRYFVLYAPPASTMLPGMCSAVLDYYDNERLLFKKGTIDLTNCVEVRIHPESDFYQHVFSLCTKHRGCDRTYYLVSDTDADMKHWVECLRAVLFLDGGFEQGREMFVRRPNGSSSVSSDPGERYIRVPEHGVSNSSSYDMSATASNVTAGAYASVFPDQSEATSVKETDADKGEAYIRLEDCYSGQHVGTSSTLPVYSAPPNKTAKQTCTSLLVDTDPTNRFGDGAHHRVEYCNEYELGEHDSVFVDVNADNCNYADDAGDDNDNGEDYCHYKYPTVHYGIHHSVLSERNESRSRSRFLEPMYVNCSYMTELNRNSGRDLCPPGKRRGICCESLLTSGDHLWSLSVREPHSVGTNRWNSCRFYPSHSVSMASTEDVDDDEVDCAHHYVNVPPMQYCVPHLLRDNAAFTSPSRYPYVTRMDTLWRK